MSRKRRRIVVGTVGGAARQTHARSAGFQRWKARDEAARSIEQSQRLAVLEESQRLAREMHNNVTQILSSISQMAQSQSAAW